MGHSPCEFMHDMLIAEIYRPLIAKCISLAIFLYTLLTVCVYLHSLLYSEPQKSYIGYSGAMRSLKVIQDH